MAAAATDDTVIQLTVGQLKSLVADTIKEAVPDAVDLTLTAMGMDVKEPLEMQKDFQFVRDWRQTSQSVKGKALTTAVAAVILGGMSLLWVTLFHTASPFK